MGILSKIWDKIQAIQTFLFPELEEELGQLSPKLKKLVDILEVLRVEDFITKKQAWTGRPSLDRAPIVRAFIAKATLNIPTTADLVEQLLNEPNLRLSETWRDAIGSHLFKSLQ